MQDFISERAQAFRGRLRMTAKGKRGAKDMTREQAKEALSFLFTAEADRAQVAAFLTAMRFKGTCLNEFLGFLDAIYDASTTINPVIDNLVNTNGPYDGKKKYLQLNPGAGILAAASGSAVIMHSSTDLPPKKGVTTAHVLESLGIPAFLSPDVVKKNIEIHRFGFLHSSVFSHGIEQLRSVREVLVYRSLLHACEVLLNPAGAKNSIVGAAHESFLHRFTEVLVEQGLNHVLTVQGLDGGDELPLQPTAAVEYKKGSNPRALNLNPADYGIECKEASLSGSPAETAVIIQDCFAGRDDSVKDHIVYNAGIRIYVSGKTPDISEGINLARRTIESGDAMKYLEKLRSHSYGVGQ